MTHVVMRQEPVLVTGPTRLPVTLGEFADHMRIDAEDEEAATITNYIGAAVSRLDGYFGLLGEALLTQTWRADFDCFPAGRRIDLPLSPVQSVVVKYSDSDNVEQTLAAANYALHTDATGAYLWRDKNQSEWASTYDRADAVRITMTCGYGDNPSDIPRHIRLAVLHTVAHWYNFREAVMMGQAPQHLPMAADELLNTRRRLQF